MAGADANVSRAARVPALGSAEIRVLGCLIEKRETTPDAYPLSLNALRLACNQSTNRDPVLAYDDGVIRDAIHRLERHGLARLASGAGSRAPKYRHLLADALPLDSAERAVLCVLMLRGPQTPGELKQRADRMHAFAALEEVHRTLAGLLERGLAARIERRPGQKEERYAHLLGSEAEDARGDDAAPAAGGAQVEVLAQESALERLERRVARLERQLAMLAGTAADEMRDASEEPIR